MMPPFTASADGVAEFGAARVYRNALDGIGNTPLVALDRINDAPARGRIWAKMELVQPGGSVKDRAAKRIIEDARASGQLRDGQPVVEMTSGNMGAGLAVVCGVLGHRFIATMSQGNSPARAVMLRALGAEVELVPQVNGRPGQVTGEDIAAAADRARALAREAGAFYVDQFNNVSGVLAHEDGTGSEIVAALGGRVDAFVASVGSGATFVGASRAIKRQCPNALCAVAEPAKAAVLAGKPIEDPRHLLQGTGYGLVPPLWQSDLADVYLGVTDDDALAMRHALAAREGLFVGFSAAANVCAAKQLLKSGHLPSNAQVVTVLCDTGLKYN